MSTAAITSDAPCDCLAFTEGLGEHSKADHDADSCASIYGSDLCGGCWECMSRQVAYYAEKAADAQHVAEKQVHLYHATRVSTACEEQECEDCEIDGCEHDCHEKRTVPCAACRCSGGAHDDDGACWTDGCPCDGYRPEMADHDGDSDIAMGH